LPEYLQCESRPFPAAGFRHWGSRAGYFDVPAETVAPPSSCHMTSIAKVRRRRKVMRKHIAAIVAVVLSGFHARREARKRKAARAISWA
jgi:hypothetical protein